MTTSTHEDVASMCLKKLGYNPIRRTRGMDWRIGPTMLAEHKRDIFQKSQVREMSTNDAILVVTDHKAILVFKLDRDASVFNVDSFGGIKLPENPISVSIDIPASLWMDIKSILDAKDMTFRDFALEALREKVEKDKDVKT
jgi:hypothetical protein